MNSFPSYEDERIAAVRRHGLLDAASDRDLDRIVQLAQTILGSESAAISLLDRDRQFFISRRGIADSHTPRETSFCTHTIQSPQPMVIPDAELDPRFSNNPFVLSSPKVRFYAGVPLADADDYALGALCVFDSTPRSITAEQLASLENLAALAIQHLELRKQASIDALTGTLNRATILRVAKQEIEDAERLRTDLAVLMVDLDHFKIINDKYGHGVGDAVLAKVGNILDTAVRKSDYVGRYGGEEFCVILPGVTSDLALSIATRIRVAIEKAVIQAEKSALTVTASIGIAMLHERDKGATPLLLAADQALYAAKGQGRNCVVFAGKN
ncbi:sensor domain-containing diguanylate cyclase [Arsenicitalea aurantiaca]|uniref:diguanylate cyclase n=1 Tax=Arsenicitalea aurantiaca TaxID=1783274 RepID=A0A433XBF3_9HYPH|nr:sensor domain-containing diguanylate cyclase [Arsenicitalea aurantiaca]RUT31431.1 sensor domain-containing diguanylate cyclase [Arsenicitalea aurantiaca]